MTNNLLINHFTDNIDQNSVSYYLRKKRFDYFLRILDISPRTQILDVGGSENTWIGTGLEANVTILNIKIYQRMSLFRYVECDACNMKDIDNKYYDVVFSNSVIEHVGGEEEQTMFANEVMRVGKKSWIQTPNKYFPIEPHFIFPFFQFMPKIIQLYIGKKWKYSHLKRNNEDVVDELSRLHLLSKSQLKKLFPEYDIYEEKYFGFTKSMAAYKV